MPSIRFATKADIPLIRTLSLQTFPQTYAPILSAAQIDFMMNLMYSPEALLQQINEGAQFIFAYENDQPIGFASFQAMDEDIYKLHKLYLLPATQGKGMGRFMIDFITRHISDQGAKSLQLQVNRFNKARDFYEKNGFVIIKEADLDIGNGYFMNDYIMEKIL